MMIRTLFFIAAILFTLKLYSQDTCALSKLSTQDKALLTQFMTDFKTAVMQKDKVKLAALCYFPFTFNNVNVTIKEFDKAQYQVFFNDRLRKSIDAAYSLESFFVLTNYNDLVKRCAYSFMFIEQEENKQHPGLQRFFDVQKIKGKFRIVSAWTLP